MINYTDDVFIINGYVYWRRIKTLFTTKPDYSLTQTDSDEFIRINYKECIKEHISAIVFYEELANFNNVKDLPEFYDILISDVLEYKWLTTIMYTSTIMVFDQ